MKKFNLYNIGLSERQLAQASMESSELYIGRVSVQYKDMYRVITEEGEVLAKVSGKLSYNLDSFDLPSVGDWVLLDRTSNDNGEAIIHHVLQRKSYFERKIAGSRSSGQIVASNIDTVFICMSLNNDFNIRRLERYISIAWDSLATPVVVLTKSDICDDIEEKISMVKGVALGIDILVTNSIYENGYEGLSRYIENGKTAAFIGSSGVGKSSLINKIIGKEVLKTNEIGIDDKGRHTTTHRELIICSGGGAIIDTPGMREIGIIGADLEKSFSDIESLSAKCKFSDCQHENEPKCAVREAINRGELDEKRLVNYKKIQREEKYSTLNSKQLEKEKINQMFAEVGGIKQSRKFFKNKKK